MPTSALLSSALRGDPCCNTLRCAVLRCATMCYATLLCSALLCAVLPDCAVRVDAFAVSERRGRPRRASLAGPFFVCSHGFRVLPDRFPIPSERCVRRKNSLPSTRTTRTGRTGSAHGGQRAGGSPTEERSRRCCRPKKASRRTFPAPGVLPECRRTRTSPRFPTIARASDQRRSRSHRAA